MVVTAAVLATLLKDPLTKALGWTFSEALKGTRNQNIEKSLKTLSEKILEVIKVKTIYKGDDSIDLHEFYVATKIDKIQGAVDSILNISDKSIVLEGTVGQGKSIFMRYLTYQEATKGQKVPIFFELRRLEDNQTLRAAISDKIKNWIPLFNDDDFEKFSISGSLVLFLDGFDEVPYEKAGRLINEIEGWCERYEDLQIIISSRPEAEIQKLNSFRVFKLSSYDFDEQSKLIDKLVPEEESRNLLKQAIEDSTIEIKELLLTPLMVTLFVMRYRASLEIPNNQNEFYQELFSVLISRHDKTKPGYKRGLSSNLTETQLQEVFEEFCFNTCNKDKLVFSHAEVIRFIDECLKRQRMEVSAENVLEDFSKVICLLLKDGMDYSFIHRSIQEYFYSSFISKKSEKAKEVFYKKCLSNSQIHNRTINILNFLKRNDTYSYNKYYQLVIIDDYIKNYQILRDTNNIINSLYFKNTAEEITIILDTMGNFESSLSCCPSEIDKLFLSISNILNMDHLGGWCYGLLDINDTEYKDSKLLKLSVDEILLHSITVDTGNKLLKIQQELQNYIRQSDEIIFEL
jgi:hypothetical protein